MKPIVAIVGRPNIGKSTLFNRLIGRRRAIVKSESGVTRDINYADCEGGRFTLVDTGGFEPAAKEGILKKVKEQVQFAIEEADLIIFLMDARLGATPQDKELIGILRKTGKKVIYAANKVDTKKLLSLTDEFYSLGIDNIFPVSAECGLGTTELLDAVLSSLPGVKEAEEAEEEGEGERVRVSIVGRPNAGKSSILNKLTGKERAIVSEIPGTTRDSLDTLFEKNGKRYLFIDTAGIRKKRKLSRALDIYSAIGAIKTIDRSDLALLTIDAKEGPRLQDEKIAGLIEDRGKGCIIVLNKWDAVEKETDTAKLYEERIRHAIPFLSYAPVLFVSALTGRNMEKIFEAIDRVDGEQKTKVPTSKLNALLKKFTSRSSPPSYRGKEVKLYYITQTGTLPLKFTVFTNLPEGVLESYRRYLINSFRESLKTTEVPLRVFFRSRR